MKTVIKIIKSRKGYDWYENKIGEQYELMFVDEPTGDYVVSLHNSKGTLGSVNVKDCEVFKVNDDVEIRKFEEKIIKKDVNNRGLCIY